MSQIKYIKCVSLVIRNFTVSWFKSDFLKKSFAGINFHGFDKSKHFAGTNFRDLVLAKIGTIKVYMKLFNDLTKLSNQQNCEFQFKQNYITLIFKTILL